MPRDLAELITGRASKSMVQILRKQTIRVGEPGPILQDFQTLIDFVGVECLPTTSKHFAIPQARLNERMVEPLQHALKGLNCARSPP